MKDEQPCTAWPEQVGATSQPPCPSEPALQDAGATRPAPPNERAMDRSQGKCFKGNEDFKKLLHLF